MGYNTKIDWCDTSWNPVTGCYHDCEYCYARGIANRFGGYNIDPIGESTLIGTNASGVQIIELEHQLSKIDKTGAVRVAPYPYEFTPTLHRYRLDEPSKWTQPRAIFVCSMADLFGFWVPDEWIKSVFYSCSKAPQHRYLFLTKAPRRYDELIKFGVAQNMWFGTSYTGEGKFIRSSASFNRFVSIEPLLCEIPQKTANAIALWNDWVIVGAETGKRKDKVVPQKEWIDAIVRACDAVQVPVFMKESLREIMGDDFRQEFPWENK